MRLLQRVKKTKKRFIFLNLAVPVAALVILAYTLCFGSHYTLETEKYYTSEAILNDCRIVLFDNDTDEIVKLEKAWIDEHSGQLKAELSSVKPGNSIISLSADVVYPDGTTLKNDQSYDFIVHVNNLGIIFLDNRFTGFKLMMFILVSLMLITELICVASFIECIVKARFTHSMIAYGGAALFVAVMCMFNVYDLINNRFYNFTLFIVEISGTGLEVTVLLVPILFILALLVSVSNVWLIHHEGFRPVNALGIAASVTWIFGLVLLMWLETMSVSWSWEINNVLYVIIDVLTSMLVYLIGYFECLIISSAFCAMLASFHKPKPGMDYIIILGCAIRSDGTPTPILRGRVDKAIEFEKNQFEKTGKHAIFVPSGGQGSDEVISEAESMKRYLTEQGIPEERILKEDKSVNTYQNMAFSKKVIEEHAGSLENVKIAFATTNYHVFRGYILSEKNGFRAEGISAPTKLYFFPNAFLREFVGLLYERKIRHVIYLVLLAAFFIGVRYIPVF